MVHKIIIDLCRQLKGSGMEIFMNYRDKFLLQMMICLAVFALARGAAMIDNEGFSKIKNKVGEYSKTYHHLYKKFIAIIHKNLHSAAF